MTNKYITWNPIIADAQTAAKNATTTYGDEDNVASLYSEYLNTILYPNYVEVWQGKLAPQEFSDKDGGTDSGILGKPPERRYYLTPLAPLHA